MNKNGLASRTFRLEQTGLWKSQTISQTFPKANDSTENQTVDKHQIPGILDVPVWLVTPLMGSNW
jgi:hypothetical protein